MPLSFPSTHPTGTIYEGFANGYLYVYDGYQWVMSPNTFTNAISAWFTSFLYRTLYTRGYIHCGYQNSSLWRNTNRTVHSTDVTVNLGDMMDYVANYMDCGFSDYHSYVFNDNNAMQGSTTTVSRMSMTTETLLGYTGNANMTVNRQDCKTLMSPALVYIYITGGGNASTDKLNTTSDTMLNAGNIGSSSCAGGTVGGLSGFFGQFYGTVGANSSSASLNFSTETWATGTWSFASSTDGQPKGLSSKVGYGYNASGTYNGSSTYYKFNDTTRSQISTFSRPESCGEENCQIGQDWGYTLGAYNGSSQNNNSTKTYYNTDSCVAMGSTTQPKGHGGASSGGCGTGSCSLLGGLPGTSM